MARSDHQAVEDGAYASLAAAVMRELERHFAPLSPGLYLVATPIGNLGDITVRALSVLASADVICCEDTRHSAKLLSHFAIRAKVRPFHEHNEDDERERILREVKSGKAIAVISDAGTPLISDPGFKLVRAAAADGLPVVVVPGASSVLAALASSGLPTDAFFFAGFLPPRSAARRARLAALAAIPGSIIVFEAPQRLREALVDMAEVLGNRPAVVARELTKLHEELLRGGLCGLAGTLEGRDVKGEIAVVVGPPEAADISDEVISARLSEIGSTLSLRDAAKAVADELGVPKARVYALGLKAKDTGA